MARTMAKVMVLMAQLLRDSLIPNMFWLWILVWPMNRTVKVRLVGSVGWLEHLSLCRGTGTRTQLVAETEQV